MGLHWQSKQDRPHVKPGLCVVGDFWLIWGGITGDAAVRWGLHTCLWLTTAQVLRILTPFFRIFSTCVILIYTCRRNLLLLKCLHLLNTWSCPAATRSSTAVAETWCGEALHLPTLWILIYSALNMSNQWLQSPWEPPVFLCLPPG